MLLSLYHWMLFPHLLSPLAIPPHPRLQHRLTGEPSSGSHSCIQTGSWKHHVVTGLSRFDHSRKTRVMSLCILAVISFQSLLRCCGERRLLPVKGKNSQQPSGCHWRLLTRAQPLHRWSEDRWGRVAKCRTMPGEGHASIYSVRAGGQVTPVGPSPDWGSRAAGGGFLPADQCAISHEAQGCLSVALHQLPQRCQ